MLRSYCALKASITFLYVGGVKISRGLLPTRFFFEFCIKYISNKNDLHNMKATQKLHIRHSNGYQGFFKLFLRYELLKACFQAS
jgi:hypothetical protein